MLKSVGQSFMKAIEVDMAEPRKNEYARADKAAAWTLLTKLYLNAEVYIGAGKYSEAITSAKKVILYTRARRSNENILL